MTGFADLVPQAQPALVGGGAEARATVGRTWSWVFDGVVDSAGTSIDLTSATGTCTILSKVGGTAITTLTFTGTTGGFTLSKDETLTGAVPAGKYVWGLYVVLSSNSVQFWGPSNSRFVVDPEA